MASSPALAHRARAAFLALARRWAGVIAAARACPPFEAHTRTGRDTGRLRGVEAELGPARHDLREQREVMRTTMRCGCGYLVLVGEYAAHRRRCPRRGAQLMTLAEFLKLAHTRPLPRTVLVDLRRLSR